MELTPKRYLQLNEYWTCEPSILVQADAITRVHRMSGDEGSWIQLSTGEWVPVRQSFDWMKELLRGKAKQGTEPDYRTFGERPTPMPPSGFPGPSHPFPPGRGE